MNDLSKELIKKMDVIGNVKVGLLHRGIWGTDHAGDHVVYASIDYAWEAGDGVLSGVNQGAANLDEAILKLWKRVTNLPPDKYVVIDKLGVRRAWRWEFDVQMWVSVDENR